MDVREKIKEIPAMSDEALRSLESETRDTLQHLNGKLDEAKGKYAAGQRSDPTWYIQTAKARRRYGMLMNEVQGEVGRRRRDRCRQKKEGESGDFLRLFHRAAMLTLDCDTLQGILKRVERDAALVA